MNRYFILRPQFGQIRLLASIKIYWSLAIISSADIPQDKVFFCDEVTLIKKSGAFGAPDFKKVDYAFHRLWRLQ